MTSNIQVRKLKISHLHAKLKRIKLSISPTRAGRIHYLTAEDVRVLLGRLPEELWERLQAVHFNDRGLGRRRPGCVNKGHCEITICAFPASASCAYYTSRKDCWSPSSFGATRGKLWPELAMRRFFLYEVFLHELGHLQLVDPSAKTIRRRFASETLAEEFARHWRRTLWSKHFDHPDPVHNAPEGKCRSLVKSPSAFGVRRLAAAFVCFCVDIATRKRRQAAALQNSEPTLLGFPHYYHIWIMPKGGRTLNEADKSSGKRDNRVSCRPVHPT